MSSRPAGSETANEPTARLREMMGKATIALALLTMLATATRAEQPQIVHIVPASEPALAEMLLTALGPTAPVLLFDPSDDEVIARAASWSDNRRCYHRPSTPKPVGALMESLTGRACDVVQDPVAFARTLWPEAQRAIVTDAADYDWLLRAAAFAGATGSALIPVAGGAALDSDAFHGWTVTTLYLTPAAIHLKGRAARAVRETQTLASADAVTAEQLRLAEGRVPDAVVIANPRDRAGFFSPASLSLLAPLLSTVHHAPLILVGDADPDRIEAEVLATLDRLALRPTYIVLVGDELALRSHRVADPVHAAGGPEARGGGVEVRVELFSQIQKEQPQDFAVGRIAAEGAGRGSVALARQLRERRKRKQKPVIFLSNADQVFALGEVISRTTANEVRNVDIPVRTYYREQITPEVVQQSLSDADVLVWEGHPRDLTLEERGGIAAQVAPDLVVLQGCYTLDRSDPFILMEKGTNAIVATSAAIYSASGSAFARSLFDALLYGDTDLGIAVRNARNYLLALAQLKRARHHADWRKTYRAALAFALWGDPTLRPRLRSRPPALPPAHWSVDGRRLSLAIPNRAPPETVVDQYRARPVPGAMLGGLLLNESRNGSRGRLKELYFTVQQPPAGLESACPAGPGWDVVSLFAPRTATLSVLARPDWRTMGARQESGSFTFPLSSTSPQCAGASPAPPSEPPARAHR